MNFYWFNDRFVQIIPLEDLPLKYNNLNYVKSVLDAVKLLYG